MAKSPKSPIAPVVGERIVSPHGNTEGVVLSVEPFITKAGENTLRVQVGTDSGEVRWVTLK